LTKSCAFFSVFVSEQALQAYTLLEFCVVATKCLQ